MPMPLRSQARIRRDINRLHELVERGAPTRAALRAVQTQVQAAAALVNDTWSNFQGAAVYASKERQERDHVVARVTRWIQTWRPVVLLNVAGAAENIRELPPSGATPDDMLRVASDLRGFLSRNPGAGAFQVQALADLGTSIEDGVSR